VINLKAHHPQLKTLENLVYEFCIDYTKNPFKGKRLVIYGENGTGKSHTCKAISRWATRHALDFAWGNRYGDNDLESRPPRCLFRKWRFLINDLKESFGKKGYGSYSEIFRELCNVELLILDDVGTDNDPNKFGVEQFYMLLEARENRWTIVTTNISPDFWEERFERRIASRLIRNTVHVALTDVPDYNSR
jgi:DNA replication protein DnaC